MTDELYRRTSFLVHIVLKGEDARYLINNFCDLLGSALVPGPSRGCNIRNYRNALVMCQLRQLHIKSGVINNHQAVGLALIHNARKITAQAE